jgi:hypothetical protein
MIIKYAIRRESNYKFVERGMSPRNLDSLEINEYCLYSDESRALDHVHWMREYAKYPDTGPKVKLQPNEKFDIVKVVVTYNLFQHKTV